MKVETEIETLMYRRNKQGKMILQSFNDYRLELWNLSKFAFKITSNEQVCKYHSKLVAFLPFVLSILNPYKTAARDHVVIISLLFAPLIDLNNRKNTITYMSIDDADQAVNHRNQ